MMASTALHGNPETLQYFIPLMEMGLQEAGGYAGLTAEKFISRMSLTFNVSFFFFFF